MMAARKRSLDSHSSEERLRKVSKISSGSVNCPVCDVTLWPNTISSHFQHELKVLSKPPAQKWRFKHNHSENGESSRARKTIHQTVIEMSQRKLDSVRRKRFRNEQSRHTNGPGPSRERCPVCDDLLSASETEASEHVSSCIASRASSDSEYETYTWAGVTRVRTTTLLSPQARANMFNGTVMSCDPDNGADTEIDVENDDTNTYGPSQFSESHIQQVGKSELVSDSKEESPNPVIVEETTCSDPSQRCLICMGNYSEPLVSVLCWHVYCEKCWLQALNAQKLCPKCKTITCAGDLRKIFL